MLLNRSTSASPSFPVRELMNRDPSERRAVRIFGKLIMRDWKQMFLAILCAAGAAGQTISVGSGAPTPGVADTFQVAWLRNGFSVLVGNPLTNVEKLGSAGLIQTFPGATNSALTYALIKPDSTETFNVQQVLAAMYAYYSGFAVGAVGYPTTDTLNCPALQSISGNSCQYQTFTGDYALFVYASPLTNGSQTFSIADPFYSQWSSLGGVTGVGPATSAQTTVTSTYGSGATYQTFDQGGIYNITSGLYSGRLITVAEPVYDLYAANGGAAGSLGLPITSALLVTGGLYQQTFEGGAIEYNPATGVATLEPPVGSVAISPAGSIAMNLGSTVTAQATVFSTTDAVLTGRTVTWLTSNGQVVAIQANGSSATLKALGAGVATVTANSGGIVSAPLSITVTAPCCQVGEGAPTQAIAAAFQSAVARDNLSLQLPAASGVMREGNGYVQQFLSTATPPVSYLIAVADGSATGYAVSGSILAAYLALGGPTSALGYPVSDATASGRQLFQQGALAGNPVQVVSGAIFTEWASLGYEMGIAGSPTSAASTFQTFSGTSGTEQSFQNAWIVADTNSSSAFVVTGLILAQYNANGGTSGNLGAPTGNQEIVNGLTQQNFEGGYIDYASGASQASVFLISRQPAVTATPVTVVAGSTVHLVAGGFNNGAKLRVSQTGQTDFLATVANGAYIWDVSIPASAASATIVVEAVDTGSSASAQASYAIRSAASAALNISTVSGDQQNGAPGALLPQPLVVQVKDANGNPVTGQTVMFTASPGAQVSPASAVTGANGQASATLRLPASAGIALVTAETGSVFVTFGAQAAAISLGNFPALAGSESALETSTAAILDYYQINGQLPQPNGPATAASLHQFLQTFCTFDVSGNQICDGFIASGSPEQTANLWRVGEFVGGAITVDVSAPNLASIRDLVSAGSPVILALSLGTAGSNFVVATGVNADSSIAIVDPVYAQTNFNAYLNGFASNNATIQGTLAAVVELAPQAPSTPGFLVVSGSPSTTIPFVGACGFELAVNGNYFVSCAGAGPYELDLVAPAGTIFTDLTPGGGRTILSGSQPASFLIAQTGSFWSIAPLTVELSASGIVSAANSSLGVAPGGLMSIYGAGLANAAVEVNGQPAQIVADLPFLINAQIPFAIPPGTATITVNSPSGTAHQIVTVSAVAPAIFAVSSTQAAITNQDNSINTPSNPAERGSTIVVYGTGLGVVAASGTLSVASAPVMAVIGGASIPPAFAGLTPGVPGLYQANIPLPSTMPPGLDLPLYLTQSGVSSNTVTVAIQ